MMIGASSFLSTPDRRTIPYHYLYSRDCDFSSAQNSLPEDHPRSPAFFLRKAHMGGVLHMHALIIEDDAVIAMLIED